MFQPLFIVIGNSFTIFVFWIHRNKLKRTSSLLINLVVADFLVGFAQILLVGACALPRYIGVLTISETSLKYIATPFQVAFWNASVFFLVLISLERALALIWLLCHRPVNKHQSLHLQCCYGMGSWDNCGCIEFTILLFAILFNNFLPSNSFFFGYDLCFLYGNPNTT